MASPSGPKTLDFGVLAFLDRVADGTQSPSLELLRAHLAAARPNATDRDRRVYDALRQYLLESWVRAPDGKKYRLKTLQRAYLHHQLTLRFRAVGKTWETAWQSASDYCSAGKPVTASTVKDHYSHIQNLLKQVGMREFCRGLEYEFPLAIHGDNDPPEGTYLHPDFLSGEPSKQAEK